MSGHNPHSHLSQPNSSWNSLQIPSYIPRQPQLAHMSNERPVVRSPLTWHSPAPPTPPEAFYSFLSNHKNLEINPLLPSFVRGPPPFGSVDLTIQSARNNTTPSPRNLASPPLPPQEFPGHNKPPQHPPFAPQLLQQHHQHPQLVRSLTPNNSNSSSILPLSGPGVIQSTGSVRDKFHGGSSGSNNNGDIPPPQMPHTAANIFIRDARQINNEIAKLAARDSRDCGAIEASMLSANEPVELVKESPYHLMKAHSAVPASPKRLSPTRPPSIPNCTPLSPRPRSPQITPINTGSATDIVNNHNLKATGNGCNMPPGPKSEVAPTATFSSENSPLSLTLPSSPTTATSNEDSVDSQTSKSRRKRKPNKTTRVSNDSDESIHERGESDMIHSSRTAILPTEQSHIGLVPDKCETLIDLDSNKVISSNNSQSNDVVNAKVLTCQSDNPPQDVSEDLSTSKQQTKDSPELRTADEVRTIDLGQQQNATSLNGEAPPVTSIESSRDEENRPQRPVTPPDEPPSVIVNNTCMNTVNRNGSNSPIPVNRSNTKILNCQEIQSSPTSPPSNQEEPIVAQNIIDVPPTTEAIAIEPVVPPVEHLDSPQKRCKRKGDSDDIETIDKIAAMIASTHGDDVVASVNINTMQSPENDMIVGEGVSELKLKDGSEETENKAQIQETPMPSNSSKISDLAELLETPTERSSPSKDLAEDSTIEGNGKIALKENDENCFEEVENKLEEMFAGIEDGEPPPCILPTPTIDEPITPEVISELGLGGVLSPLKLTRPAVAAADEIIPPKPHNKEESNSSKLSNHHNSNQKRSHSNSKSDNSPPKKKRKMSKKSSQSGSSGNQKSSSSNSSKPSKSHSSTGSSNGSKPTKSNDKPQPSTSKEKVKDDPLTVEYKGPFIQVKTDGTINVINAPTAEDVVEKQNKVKKAIHNHSHGDRGKIRGLHVSTLSMKYDADTTDTTWMCVFCKKGPHKMGLGDLFGPYIITTTCEGFAYSQKDPNDDDFISKRTKADMVQRHINGMPVVPASTSSLALATVAALNSIQSGSSSTSKKKRKANDSPSLQNATPSCSTPLQSALDNEDIFVGMTKVSDTTYEVWVHENCVVWSSGVYIIGARIVALDTAVWSSTRYRCSVCSKNGAMISCFQRGCDEKAHIPCARMHSWALDENEFRCTCGKHLAALQIES